MMAASDSTAPPSPTLAPPGASTPASCWQRFDAHARANGIVAISGRSCVLSVKLGSRK